MKQSTHTHFGGGEAKRDSFFGSFERWLVGKVVPHIPQWIETYHLTFCTLPLSAVVVLFSYLAQENSLWLVGVCACIFVQYITDLFDGSLGRYRNTGLVKWGFFMDHFLDFIFFALLVASWAFLVPTALVPYVLITLVFWVGFIVHSLLYFGATNQFIVSYSRFGPTEFRLGVIVCYLYAAFAGSGIVAQVLPGLAAGSGIVLFGLVWNSHKSIWQLDMVEKNRQ